MRATITLPYLAAIELVRAWACACCRYSRTQIDLRRPPPPEEELLRAVTAAEKADDLPRVRELLRRLQDLARARDRAGAPW